MYKMLSILCASILLSLLFTSAVFAANKVDSFRTPLTQSIDLTHFTIKMPSIFHRVKDSTKLHSDDPGHSIHVYRYDADILKHELSITFSAGRINVTNQNLINNILIDAIAHTYNTLYLKIPVNYRYLMSNQGIKNITINKIPGKEMFFTSEDEDEYLHGFIYTNYYDNEVNVIIATSLVQHKKYDDNSLKLLHRILETLTPKKS